MADLAMTPLTELDAVNIMLMSIGQSPVNTITATGIKDVEIAQLVLHNTSRSVQTKGWAFNSDFALKILPDGNNRILIGPDVMHIDPVDPGEDWVQRWDAGNSKMSMYNLTKQTFDRTSSLSVDIVRFFQFEQIPQAARDYIGIKAARIFQAGAVASEILFRFEQVEEDAALTTFMRNQSITKDRNILTGNPDFTAQIFLRRRNP